MVSRQERRALLEADSSLQEAGFGTQTSDELSWLPEGNQGATWPASKSVVGGGMLSVIVIVMLSMAVFILAVAIGSGGSRVKLAISFAMASCFALFAVWAAMRHLESELGRIRSLLEGPAEREDGDDDG